MVVLEVDAFLLAATAQQQERGYGQQYTNPLPMVQALAKHQQGSDEHHYRARGIDRTNDGQGQMLHAEIAQDPAGQHDKRLEYNILMYLPATGSHMEYAAVQRIRRCTQNNEREEYQRREQGIQEQDGNYGVLLQSLLLKRIVAA